MTQSQEIDLTGKYYAVDPLPDGYVLPVLLSWGEPPVLCLPVFTQLEDLHAMLEVDDEDPFEVEQIDDTHGFYMSIPGFDPTDGTPLHIIVDPTRHADGTWGYLEVERN